MTEERPQQKQPAPHWIAEDSINVIDGWCWGVNSYGKSICVGKEKDILEKLQKGESVMPLEHTPNVLGRKTRRVKGMSGIIGRKRKTRG